MGSWDETPQVISQPNEIFLDNLFIETGEKAGKILEMLDEFAREKSRNQVNFICSFDFLSTL